MTMRVLAALALVTISGAGTRAQTMGPRDVDALPVSSPTLVEGYGAAPVQVGELRVPTSGKGPFPVAIVIHGGCWTKGFAQMRNTSALADALTRDGIATWNIDYRQIGEPGAGWPGTFQDWGAAADHLRSLSARYPLDLKRVITVGHSAGAPAALWLAARRKLPTSSPVRGKDPLPIRAAVAIDGPGDLAPFIGADAQICGKAVIVPFLGATPTAEPARYQQASPYAQLPLGVPQYLVSSSPVLPADVAQAYRSGAVKAGDSVKIIFPKNGGHFDIIAPQTIPGAEVKSFVEGAVPPS